jgi:hypothetical protein
LLPTSLNTLTAQLATKGRGLIVEAGEYESTLDRLLLETSDSGTTTLEKIVSSSRGAYPTLVVERLMALGRLPNLSSRPRRSRNDSLPGVELHPLDYEWYFTPESAKEIATYLPRDGGRTLFLGTPTVATCWAAFAGSSSVLVDRNALLRTHWQDWPTCLNLFLHDIRDPLNLPARSFSAAFFDAPWYPDTTLRWLQQASHLVRPAGLIAFALFPDLVRPNAAEERRYILDFASSLGRVEVAIDAVTYATPRFELEALRAAGVERLSEWRRGDLIMVENHQPFRGQFVDPDEPREVWDTYVIGRQVVKLRRSVRGTPRFELSTVDGCPDWVLPTVSARDPRRSGIDLWTSRNHVAQVGQRALIAKFLDQFAHFGLNSELPGQLSYREHSVGMTLRALLS